MSLHSQSDIQPLKRNLREQLVEQIGGDIVQGRLLPGKPLPNEEELLSRYDVSRTVLRKDVATGWKWQPTREVAWYASTQNDSSAAYYAVVTRGHWGVENRVHYVLDVSMHEDASRVRKSPTILSILRSFALNILRFNKVNNVADALWRNAMNLNRVLAYGGV